MKTLKILSTIRSCPTGHSYESAVSLTLCNACNPNGQLRIQKTLSMQADENNVAIEYLKNLIKINEMLKKVNHSLEDSLNRAELQIKELKKTATNPPPVFKFFVN